MKIREEFSKYLKLTNSYFEKDAKKIEKKALIISIIVALLILICTILSVIYSK